MQIRGNTVLVTGGNRGLGLAIAHKLKELDNRVIIVGRDSEQVSRAVDEVGAVAGYSCDLTDEGEIDRLAELLARDHPDLNVLINNAGVQYALRFTDEAIPYPRIRTEIATNLTAPVVLTALLLPTLASHEQAAVVNVSSALAFAPKESAPVYCASKAALHSFSKSLRYQLEGSSVEVFELIPPLVDTDMTRDRSEGKMSPAMVADALVRGIRRGQEEIAVGMARKVRRLLRLIPGLVERKMRSS